ncbi:MAG: carboxyl transferase domain-containing protein, partial [Bacillota bacterium]
VICFVDTAGAFCGIGAEERGQGQAIAENMMEMMTLKVHIISVFIGEGGSGGALALAVADEVWMLQNSVYSVISPEGCASILWKDASKTKEAAESLKLTAEDLYGFGVVERIIDEPEDFSQIYDALKTELYQTIVKNNALPVETLLANRYKRFRKLGVSEP